MAAPDELQRDFLSFEDPVPSDAEADLDDAQIAALLSEAASRLAASATPSSAALATLAADAPLAVSRLPKLNPGRLAQPYVRTAHGVAKADAKRLLDPEQRRLAGTVRTVEDPVVVRKREMESKKATAGPQWYNLPRTDLTPDLKRDLQLLKMRSVLDPKRHYRKETGKAAAPEYAHVGTIIEGPTEYYNARLTNKERKKTLVDEILEAERASGRFKRKYGEIQEKKTSGKKGHYNALRAKRTQKFKRR